jgi:hypothetical protein
MEERILKNSRSRTADAEAKALGTTAFSILGLVK